MVILKNSVIIIFQIYYAFVNHTLMAKKILTIVCVLQDQKIDFTVKKTLSKTF